MEKLKTRGGKRAGAGRPRGVNVPYKHLSITVREEDLSLLKERAEISEKTLSRYLIDCALGRI